MRCLSFYSLIWADGTNHTLYLTSYTDFGAYYKKNIVFQYFQITLGCYLYDLQVSTEPDKVANVPQQDDV